MCGVYESRPDVKSEAGNVRVCASYIYMYEVCTSTSTTSICTYVGQMYSYTSTSTKHVQAEEPMVLAGIVSFTGPRVGDDYISRARLQGLGMVHRLRGSA